jgi:DNA-binding phage protein
MLDPKQFRDNPKAIAKYLNAAFEKSDLNGILDAIKIVMQAQNVTELAEVKGCAGMASTKLSDAAERILSSASSFAGLDVRLVVKV